MDVKKLTENILPIYNKFNSEKNNCSPFKLIEYMWDIGEIIKYYLNQNEIKPHTLYREVYGMSETSTNSTRKSWISREFQGRCFRVRNIFESRIDIQNELKNLKTFSFFRESMPFFDNPKYILKGEDKQNLLKMLNSKSVNLKMIRELQRKRIGITNSRNQRLKDLENEKIVFIEFYNHLYDILKSNKDEILQRTESLNLDHNFISLLAKNTMACSNDNYRYENFTVPEIINDQLWLNYSKVLQLFINQTNPKIIRRFRRLVPESRMANVYDMLVKISNIIKESK